MDGTRGSFNKQTGWKVSEARVEGCVAPCVMYRRALKYSSPKEALARLMPLNTQLFLLRLDSASPLHAYVILWLKEMYTWVQGFFCVAVSFHSTPCCHSWCLADWVMVRLLWICHQALNIQCYLAVDWQYFSGWSFLLSIYSDALMFLSAYKLTPFQPCSPEH